FKLCADVGRDARSASRPACGFDTMAVTRTAARGAGGLRNSYPPNTGWLSDLVELDGHGFVKTGKTVGADRPFETSRQGIFAIGDVRAGSVKRVASAAGEGSVVVPGIYEFLGDPSRHGEPLRVVSSSSTNFSEVA
ncbi:MAG: hypothetical protein WCE38_18040, partial [Burkholderiales bacterium]